MSAQWFPFYVGDFVRDTLDLNAEEIGCYVLLICHYWANGSLPNDNRKLSQIARVPFDRWMGVIDDKGEIVGSICSSIAPRFLPNWRHRRIDEELAKTEAISLKRSMAARNALKTNAKSEAAIARQMHKQLTCNSTHNHNHNNRVLSTSLAKGPAHIGPLSDEALTKWGIRGGAK